MLRRVQQVHHGGKHILETDLTSHLFVHGTIDESEVIGEGQGK